MKKVFLLVTIILLIPIVIFILYYSILFSAHYFIIVSKPDTSKWNLSNETYTVVPVIDDDNVTFYVENKHGVVVFRAEEGWRTWDFDSINIYEDNSIVAISGDVGSFVYEEVDDSRQFALKSTTQSGDGSVVLTKSDDIIGLRW